MADKPARGPAFIGAVIVSTLVAILLAFLGYLLVKDGFELMRLGGSWYYLLAGAGLIVTAVLLAMRRPLAGVLYGAITIATILWALWESGMKFWPLLPRVFSPAVIGLLVLIALFSLARKGRGLGVLTTAVSVIAGFAVMIIAMIGQGSIGEAKGAKSAAASGAAPIPASDAPTEWRYYGRDPGGTRFAPYDQINLSNVASLERVWQIRTGDMAINGSEDQNTPSQIGDTLYLCTPTNKVIAVEAETGKIRWKHDPQVRPGGWNRCRGVGYYDRTATAAAPATTAPTPTPAAAAAPTPAPAAAPAAAAPAMAARAPAVCDKRIISTTIDARLFALDAATGVPCPGFGQNGSVDLKQGQGEVRRGFYFQTSAPLVARGNVIIGGWVQDNTELAEPSGVVRAFSADTGALVWAWDLGNPSITKEPPAGGSYTRGTPNVWSTAAYDEAMGLIFVPTGNATPDYWGSHRTPESEKYASSVVALDVTTGRPRWSFQTVHHDVWDWDVPSQPMLIDFPDGKGGKTPAVVQLTKRGQIFVLDRATGTPLVEVTERQVPQGPMPGEWLSPTQPYSAMPAIDAETITERLMWGHTPLDQLSCRIRFHKLRYEGEFTPPGPPEKPNLQYPGNGGGMNWGSGSYDAVNNRLLVNTVRSPIMVSLRRSTRPNMQLDRAPNRDPRGANAIPYQSSTPRFESDFGIPCLQPPYGNLTAIDLNTRQVLWSRPTGTAEELGPNYGRWWNAMKERREERRSGADTKAGGAAGPAPKAPEAKAPAAAAAPANANVESAAPPPGRGGEAAAAAGGGRGGGAGAAAGGGGRGAQPKALRSRLKITVGTLGIGGTVTTAGGLTFHGATMDRYIRAYDTATGNLVWEDKLPVGVGGTPMTFVSPKDGRQYLVVSAGGSRNQNEEGDRGDYVIAYAIKR